MLGLGRYMVAANALLIQGAKPHLHGWIVELDELVGKRYCEWGKKGFSCCLKLIILLGVP